MLELTAFLVFAEIAVWLVLHVRIMKIYVVILLSRWQYVVPMVLVVPHGVHCNIYMPLVSVVAHRFVGSCPYIYSIETPRCQLSLVPLQLVLPFHNA